MLRDIYNNYDCIFSREIFSIKEWRNLEIWVCGRLRSLKMAPFSRPYTIYLLIGHCKYSSVLYHFLYKITMIVSLVVRYLASKNGVTLKYGFAVV